tara:strand:- start:1775 stop:2014 length:240 start_codon:yes stop_codon:yes gene_type:complete
MNDYDLKKIKNIEDKLVCIENKVDYIIMKLDNNIIKSCNNMDKHIGFIEKVYDIVKYPLFFIINKINVLSTFEKKNIEL